jgi:hypothetical protein
MFPQRRTARRRRQPEHLTVAGLGGSLPLTRRSPATAPGGEKEFKQPYSHVILLLKKCLYFCIFNNNAIMQIRKGTGKNRKKKQKKNKFLPWLYVWLICIISGTVISLINGDCFFTTEYLFVFGFLIPLVCWMLYKSNFIF